MSDEPRKPAPVVLRIKVRYEEPEAVVVPSHDPAAWKQLAQAAPAAGAR